MTEMWFAGVVGLFAGVLLAALVYWRVRRAADAEARQVLLLTQQRDALAAERDGLREQLAQLGESLASLTAEKARLEARHEGQQEKLQWLEQSREQLKQDFEQLSARIFETRSKQLQEQNRSGMDDLLKPFREQLADFRRRVDQIHTEDNKNQASLSEQLRQLQQLNQQMVEDARHLTNALKGQSKTQGNWGEMILERILEESGLVRGREYETQVSIADEDGRRRQPDVVVHLPEDKDVIVDAKVSLTAYERFCREEDDDARRRALDEHVQSVRAHVRGLSRKDYEGLEGLKTLDFVLLFIPVEAAFLLAMEAAPELYNEAYHQHIVLVSPTTLMVTLRTINNIWRQEYQNRNALDIADRAGRICDQIALLEESWREVGQRLEQAQDAWTKSRNRLSSGRGNLLRQAQTLQSLGARARKALPQPDDALDALPDEDSNDDD